MDLSLQRPQNASNRISQRVMEIFTNTESSDNTCEIKLENFKKLIPSKDGFFAERVFRILDKDGSNGISISEMRLGLEQLCSQSVEDRVRFLFRIYDTDGDGLIQLHDLRTVLSACSKENGMVFSEEQLDQLTVALYEDAVESDPQNASNGLKYEHLKAQLDKHPGLVDELSSSLVRSLSWKVPPVEKPPPKSKCSALYMQNNAAFIFFLSAYITVNLALLISRAYQFRKENPYYMCARMFGQALNFNCAFVVVLMLRRCITWLRQTQIAMYLPLDNHAYFHKLCGIVIVIFGFSHTVMHLINFPLNLADRLVSPITNETHSATEWLFTMEPGMFGLIPGIANLTGWGLLVILIVMLPCSMPFIRRSGYFELFYWTHLLYFPFLVLLFLHGVNCWKWLIGPTIVFILLEKFCRFRNRRTNQGKTFVSYAVLLPSRVTHLVCRKPANFHFHPGDYVYLNIPEIASSEWHPFTISSAPEQPDDLWLHIRCVGGWTNKLYEHFKSEQIKNASKASMDIEQSSQSIASHHTCVEIPLIPSISTRKSISEFQESTIQDNHHASLKKTLSRTESVTQAGYRYMRHPPRVISCIVPTEESCKFDESNRKSNKRKTRVSFADDKLKDINISILDEIQSQDQQNSQRTLKQTGLNTDNSENYQNPKTEGIQTHDPLEIRIDGPYGTPSSHIFRAEHAVLIAAGIGVTPYASILQSIMHRNYANRQTCPRCQHEWAPQMPDSIMNLKKVDFFWINRDQRSFEWFVQLLSQLEIEQAELSDAMDRFLDLHMYITSALEKSNMKAIGLQMALDLLHAKEKRDLVTGLKTRTNAGRPNWNQVFQKLAVENKGEVTVFYCGPPQLAKTLKTMCTQFGFQFRKEVF